MANLPYRPCVGIMLIKNGRVWIGDRIAQGKVTPDPRPQSWQMPQGGIDPGEAPNMAAMRELEEEVGTPKAEIIGEAPDWLNYDLPKKVVGKALRGRYQGQTQKWFAMRFLGQDHEISLTSHHQQEFSSWRWAELDEVVELIVPFKRPVYEKVAIAFRDLVEAERTTD